MNAAEVNSSKEGSELDRPKGVSKVDCIHTAQPILFGAYKQIKEKRVACTSVRFT